MKARSRTPERLAAPTRRTSGPGPTRPRSASQPTSEADEGDGAPISSPTKIRRQDPHHDEEVHMQDAEDEEGPSPTEMATPTDPDGRPIVQPVPEVIPYRVVKTNSKGERVPDNPMRDMGVEADEPKDEKETTLESMPGETVPNDDISRAVRGVEARMTKDLKQVKEQLQTTLTTSLSRIEQVAVQSRNIDLLAEALRHEAAGRRDDTAALARQLQHLRLDEAVSQKNARVKRRSDVTTPSQSSSQLASEPKGKICILHRDQPKAVQVDLNDDDEKEVRDGLDEDIMTPQKLPHKPPQGRWRPPTMTAEQKKKGWMPGVQEENKGSDKNPKKRRIEIGH